MMSRAYLRLCMLSYAWLRGLARGALCELQVGTSYWALRGVEKAKEIVGDRKVPGLNNDLLAAVLCGVGCARAGC